MAVGAWVALASPPEDPAAVIDLGEGALRLGLDPWLQPEFRLGDLRAASLQAVPLGELVHLAGDWRDGVARLLVNGEEVARVEGPAPERLEGTLTVGRAPEAGLQQEVHALGALNGVLGAVTLRQDSRPVEPGLVPEAPLTFGVPEAWYADDPDRPLLHPLGPKGWTNEPHALTYRDGLWHLYHQANPNGAYWRHIVWGHLVSEDLVRWDWRLPALIPGKGFDSRGIWVGNWIPEAEPPAVLYTGVNGQWSGLDRAVARFDGSLQRAETVALDTPLGYQDMRDPWVLRTEDGWLALVGSGRPDGSEALILAWQSSDGVEWHFEGEFDTGGVEIPGEFWELPVLVPLGNRWMLMGTPVTGEPAQTLYWMGTFDGQRFVPDDPAPRRYDLFRTLRAPTIATGPDGELIAVGIIADEQRDEATRRPAGWVHVLGVATRLSPCRDDPSRLCQSLAPSLAHAFDRPLVRIENEPLVEPVRLELEWLPVLLRLRIEAAARSTLRLGVRATSDGAPPSAQLIVQPAEGRVALEYSIAPAGPRHRAETIWSEVPAGEAAVLELILDRAAISGNLNGRGIGFLAFADGGAGEAIVLEAEGSVTVRELELLAMGEVGLSR